MQNEEVDRLFERITQHVVTSATETHRAVLLLMVNSTEPNSQAVAGVLSSMVKTTHPCEMMVPSAPYCPWDANLFHQSVNELIPNLSWRDVFLKLDIEEFEIGHSFGLKLLLEVYSAAFDMNDPNNQCFLANFAIRGWKNAKGQLSLLKRIIENPDIFRFADYPYIPVPTAILKEAPNLDREDKIWLSLNFIQALIRLSFQGMYYEVKEIFERPIAVCPDVFVLALIKLSYTTGLPREILLDLVPTLTYAHKNSVSILRYSWNTKDGVLREIIMKLIYEWCVNHCNYKILHQILDAFIEIKAFPYVLDTACIPLGLEMASVAYWKGYLNLKGWMRKRMFSIGKEFIAKAVQFIKAKCPYFEDLLYTYEELPFSRFTTTVLLEVMTEHAEAECIEFLPSLKGMMDKHLKMLKKCQNQTPQGIIVMFEDSIPESARYNFPGECPKVDRMVSTYVIWCFNRVYGESQQTLTTDELLTEMESLRNSSLEIQRDIFDYMVRKLIEKYPFLHEDGRAKMGITAKLYGGLIGRGLCRNLKELLVFLGLILDALNNPVVSVENDFGLFALEQFNHMVYQLPYFCKKVMNLPHVYEFPPIIIKHVKLVVETAASEDNTNIPSSNPPPM